ncbi:helix-turn-helix domain-containing protein [Salinilacihabitans rarus]|uniref:helix-turn-helix domain-containing protein n=1 Tax=Salinilacihabitans rarus TaxID=2961596 RepID=UPI0020C834D3|nr:helix-turn-helix domain-containing protein [Salinilacihabitans rarus]
MGHLDDVTVPELRRALDRVEGKTPTLRLVAAIAYKNGVTQTELADWFGVDRRTIYNWLDRLDRRPLAAAARDERRPGRPRKLTADQRAELEAALEAPPAEAGYDARAWTPALVRRHLRERFDVAYSRASCRRLLKGVGYTYDAGARRWRPPE